MSDTIPTAEQIAAAVEVLERARDARLVAFACTTRAEVAARLVAEDARCTRYGVTVAEADAAAAEMLASNAGGYPSLADELACDFPKLLRRFVGVALYSMPDARARAA